MSGARRGVHGKIRGSAMGTRRGARRERRGGRGGRRARPRATGRMLRANARSDWPDGGWTRWNERRTARERSRTDTRTGEPEGMPFQGTMVALPLSYVVTHEEIRTPDRPVRGQRPGTRRRTSDADSGRARTTRRRAGFPGRATMHIGLNGGNRTHHRPGHDRTCRPLHHVQQERMRCLWGLSTNGKGRTRGARVRPLAIGSRWTATRNLD